MAFSRRGGHSVSPASNDNLNNNPIETRLNKWITRNHDVSIQCNGVYHGIVEKIQSKGAATVVIGEIKRGIPLLMKDDWSSKKYNFTKVLLMVERLRPSIDQPAYDRDTVLRDKVKEGEMLFLVVEEARKSPENLFKYIASSAYKIEASGKVVDESVMTNILDPLRGVVDSYVSADVGIIRFGTYSGVIAKALFKSSCYKSAKIDGGSSLKSIAPINTMVYLDVTRWHMKTRTHEWENLLYKDGILFKATLVWPKDDSKPDKTFGDRGKMTNREPQKGNYRGFSEEIPSLFDANSKRNQISYLLSDIHAYYGIVELIPSMSVAVICTAHRGGEPVSWTDNWLAKGVSLERILLISDHVRLSKNAPESTKGTPIKTLLQTGDQVKVVVEPTIKTPEKCYKWFAKSCWKETEETGGFRFPIPVNLLPGHLCGKVESIVSQDMGIISFKTFHGQSALAFFNHQTYFKDGSKILTHIPLGSEIEKGTRVHLICDKWFPGRSSKNSDQQIADMGVNYRVVMAWEIGTSRPGESDFENKGSKYSHSSERKTHRQGRNEPNEISPSSASKEEKGIFKSPFRGRGGGGNRGGRRGRRGHEVKYGQNQSGNDDTKSCGDWVDLSENLAELSELLGTASVSNENLYETSSYHSESKPLNIQRNEGLKDKDTCMKKNYSLMAEKRDTSVKYSHSDNLSNSYKNVKSPSSDGTKSGTLISVDESWGLMNVEGDNLCPFKSNSVYMYGLKIEDVPLHQLFRQGQSFKVHMEGGQISAVEYGAPQLPNIIRKAVSMYCENNSIDEDVRHKLEFIMRSYGV